ncbi:MAG: protein kinase [Polyangiaceae bacterium]
MPESHGESLYAAELLPGRLVDEKFRITRSLAQGGMAAVVLAHDIDLDRDVALKFIGRPLLENPAWRERFNNEARLMARLHHPNVVQVHSFGVHVGWPYFVMEYVGGGTLGDWMRRNPAPAPNDVALLIHQIASGLDAIHAAGLVHHDIKPANILLSQDGRALIADLGLARLTRGAPAINVGIAGTPRYMAPEQALPDTLSPELARRTDVYQLALTAFEMLVGTVPFEHPDPLSLLTSRRTQRAPSPSSLRPDLGAAVDRAILSGLEREPRNRPHSAGAFADALMRAAPTRSFHGQAALTTSRAMHVVVADDDPSQLAATALLLSGALPSGSEIARATNGIEALNMLETGMFDVAVLDLEMPGMSAIEILATLRANGNKTRVIVVTAMGGAGDWRVLRQLGADGLILKPFDVDQLVATIERHANE